MFHRTNQSVNSVIFIWKGEISPICACFIVNYCCLLIRFMCVATQLWTFSLSISFSSISVSVCCHCNRLAPSEIVFRSVCTIAKIAFNLHYDVCPSVSMYQRDSHWLEWHKILYWGLFFLKFCRENSNLVKIGKNIEKLMWRPKNVLLMPAN
jgi:hypothetical protein